MAQSPMLLEKGDDKVDHSKTFKPVKSDGKGQRNRLNNRVSEFKKPMKFSVDT